MAPGDIASTLQSAFLSNVPKINGQPQQLYDGQGSLYSLSAGVLTCAITNNATPQQVLTNVAYLAVDSAGEVVALQGSNNVAMDVYYYLGGSGRTFDMFDTSSVLDSTGYLYMLQSGVLSGAATSANVTAPQQLATGLTQIAPDSAGEAVALVGTNAYSYYSAGTAATGTSAGQQYAIGSTGQLYALSANGALTSAATSTSTPEQIATSVTRIAMDAAGEVVVLQGPYFHIYFSGMLEIAGSGLQMSAGGVLVEHVEYALGADGTLYSLSPAGGVVSARQQPQHTPSTPLHRRHRHRGGQHWYTHHARRA